MRSLLVVLATLALLTPSWSAAQPFASGLWLRVWLRLRLGNWPVDVDHDYRER
jgi:hypothetical protein